MSFEFQKYFYYNVVKNKFQKYKTLILKFTLTLNKFIKFFYNFL